MAPWKTPQRAGRAGQSNNPITQQPGTTGGSRINKNKSPQNLPQGVTGLECLTTTDKLMVHQEIELWEVVFGVETQNKYMVQNSSGENLFYAVEDSDFCSRTFCGARRPFKMKLMDIGGRELIRLNRPCTCNSCFFPCCLQTMEVFAPPGTLIGSIEQECNIICMPQFLVKNVPGGVVQKIRGPWCAVGSCGDVNFKVMSKDGKSKIGEISKIWSGFLREAFTDADYFEITYPMDLDVRMKAVLLGACFLIDYAFFEDTN